MFSLKWSVQTPESETRSQQDSRNRIWVTDSTPVRVQWHRPIMQERCKATSESLCTLQIVQSCLYKPSDLSTTPGTPPQGYLLSRDATPPCYFCIRAAIQLYMLPTLTCLVMPGGLQGRETQLAGIAQSTPVSRATMEGHHSVSASKQPS